MPAISLGHPDDNGTMFNSTLDWLSLGGRGIDTAMDYHNQKDIGAALNAASATHPRSTLFLTSKISPMICSEITAMAQIKSDLSELGIEQLDLVLHHFPCSSEKGTQAVYRALQKAQKLGLTRAIGVSNYGKKDLDAVLSLGGTPPAVNQCQMSVGSHDDETISYCQTHKIFYEAFSPLRHVNLTESTLTQVAQSHGVTTAQVALRWVVQKNVLVVTSPGINKQYAEEDLAIGTFTLTEDEMIRLDAVKS